MSAARKKTAAMPTAEKETLKHHKELLARMLLIRRFEERCVELYSAGTIRGFVHLYIAAAVPGADPSGLGPHDVIRDALEIDSLDFLSFVEMLSERSGVAIDEDDYDAFTTLGDSAEFLLARQDTVTARRTP